MEDPAKKTRRNSRRTLLTSGTNFIVVVALFLRRRPLIFCAELYHPACAGPDCRIAYGLDLLCRNSPGGSSIMAVCPAKAFYLLMTNTGRLHF